MPEAHEGNARTRGRNSFVEALRRRGLDAHAIDSGIRMENVAAASPGACRSDLSGLSDDGSRAYLVAAAAREGTIGPARQRIERDFATLAEAYPHIYQIRYLDTRGHEVIRVDRRDGEVDIVTERDFQDKSNRYYVHEILSLGAGEIYVSPLDLNVEGDTDGAIRGLLVINLYAEIMLDQIQQIAGMRGGITYLFNRSGFYLA
ncbi:MAG: diguanylate cyclase, partial [Rhodospirillaceae bacterium]